MEYFSEINYSLFNSKWQQNKFFIKKKYEDNTKLREKWKLKESSSEIFVIEI